MNRQEFLNAIETVAPALADNLTIPILSYIWFEGTTVMAFNNQLAIRTPLQSGFVGAVPGKLIISLVKASKAKDLTLDNKGSELVIKAARANLKLPVLPEESFIFELPKVGDVKSGLKVELLSEAMRHCLRSVAKDSAVIEQTGITCIFDAAGVSLYSTNNQTLCHARVSLGTRPLGLMNTDQRRLTLPAVFCKELLSLYKEAAAPDKVLIWFGDEHATALVGKTTTFTRLISSEGKTLDYPKVIKSNMPAKLKLSVRPQSLPLAVSRAKVIAESYESDLQTNITVTNGEIEFYTKSPHGEAIDTLEADGPQDDTAIACQPKYLEDTEDFHYMNISERCVLFSTQDQKSVYMVAGSAPKGK